MRLLLDAPRRRVLASALILLLLLETTPAQADPTTSASYSVSAAPTPEPTCEAKTINYITHTLPQQCLTASPSASILDSLSLTTTVVSSTPTETATQTSSGDGAATEHPELDADGNDLSTGAFMSFEEWKAMMLEKSGQEELEARPRKTRDGQAYPGDDFDSLGEEGEISLDFGAYSDKISEITSSTKPSRHEKDREAQVEKVTYDEGLAHGYRSKDAGKTCKERFSYSSFDAGATVLKASPGAKNPKAILIENKDSYMLLECAMKNKFFIVELSDDILVDTVVLANFEFFSSMIRHFRVSVGDRYPMKEEKWKVLGTFEARNSRDIQPFLVQNPQIWARYLRIEILSHYGNEYYCPVSLLRVHGTRMLDSWKEADPADLELEEDLAKPVAENTEETPDVIDEPIEKAEIVEPVRVEQPTMVMEQDIWMPYWDGLYFKHNYEPEPMCAINDTPVPTSQIQEEDQQNGSPAKPQPADTVEQAQPTTSSTTSSGPTTIQSAEQSTDSSGPGSPTPSSREASASATENTTYILSDSLSSPTSTNASSGYASSTSGPPISARTSVVTHSSKTKAAVPTSIKPPSQKPPVKTPSGSQTTPRNKTSTSTTPAAASPTVQDSFFKALTKRLQTLESNTTLSLQYIESQSKFLQEALARLEKRQVAKVDLFLDTLNKTVLGELREVRTQYDQIWQSTVIALETQREQSEREIVALSSRLGVLADEVVFQKRMAIMQSVLLLGCLVLVIFSRGLAGAGASIESYYPNQFLGSSSRLASPIFPSTPKGPPPPLKDLHHTHHHHNHHHNGNIDPSLLTVEEPSPPTHISRSTRNHQNATLNSSPQPPGMHLNHNHSHSHNLIRNLDSNPETTPPPLPLRNGNNNSRRKRRPGSRGTDSESSSSPGQQHLHGHNHARHKQRPPSPPNRALTDPSGISGPEYFNPAMMNDMEAEAAGYDSEPTAAFASAASIITTPSNNSVAGFGSGADYFSAAASMDGDDENEDDGQDDGDVDTDTGESRYRNRNRDQGRGVASTRGGGMGVGIGARVGEPICNNDTYPEMLARQSERQLTPTSDVDSAEYVSRSSGRPVVLTRAGSARKPLPALPEDPD
ncbi:hypothetical protein F4775DRAFT_533235 [Biscogniauxia sp. FL1348]|nr:hypothetical protein F4775DRAFT_533235 [Biscogniauxia sp. FL1348]